MVDSEDISVAIDVATLTIAIIGEDLATIAVEEDLPLPKHGDCGGRGRALLQTQSETRRRMLFGGLDEEEDSLLGDG